MDQVYNKLIQAVELDNIFLRAVNSERFPSSGFKGEIQTEISMEQRLEFRTENRIVTSVQFDVDAFDEFNKENKLFMVQTIFILEYRLENIEEEEINSVEFNQAIEDFVRINVPVNAWPYGRELIGQMTTRMGLPQLVIGTYKYIPSQNINSEE